MTKKYPYPPGEGRIRWISTDWLEEHRDKNLMIVDVQPNVHDYILEHIPGAVYFNEGLLRVPLKGRPAVYCPDGVIQANFRRTGLISDQAVVVYTGLGGFKKWGDGLEQTMMAYTLVRFGHTAVYLLDGGLDKWKKEGKPVTKVFPPVRESTFTVEVQRDFYVEYEEFKSAKDRSDVILLDARPPPLYEGQGPWIKPGHIPGAVNLPWTSLMTAENTRLLNSEDEIQTILESKGITRDKTVICSCGTGREATNEFILFKWYLNYPKVKIYEGSFTEWTAYPENPTVTGKNPR
jgi:thiosulfate/3-mercaptopyruvate sulfurtransferase